MFRAHHDRPVACRQIERNDICGIQVLRDRHDREEDNARARKQRRMQKGKVTTSEVGSRHQLRRPSTI